MGYVLCLLEQEKGTNSKSESLDFTDGALRAGFTLVS